MDVRSNVYERRTLGDVCTLQRGFDLPTKDRSPGEYTLVTSSGPTDTHDEAKVAGPGVVTGRSGSIGNVFFIEGDFWPLNTTLYVKDFHGNDERYVFYLLQFLDLGKFASGAGVPTLNRNHVHSEPVQVACNLAEQKRIVAVLDQAFAALDRVRAHAEANLADVSDLKRRGADRLLHRHAASAPRRRLGELAEFRNGLNFSRHSSGETVKVAGVGNFQSNFWVPLDELAFATIDGQLSDSDKLCAGDILAVRSNGNEDLVGRVMLMGDVDEVVSYSGFVIRIRLTADKLDPRFLCHYIKSDEAIAHLRAGGGGANISNLNQKVLSSLTVPVPSLEEQRAFIDSMASLDTSVDTLTELAASKVADLAALRQSLLQKAFAGELA